MKEIIIITATATATATTTTTATTVIYLNLLTINQYVKEITDMRFTEGFTKPSFQPKRILTY